MSNSTSSSSKASGLTTTHKILIGGFAFIAVILIAGAIIVFNLLNKEATPAQSPGGNYVIDENNLTEITSDISSKVKDSMFEVQMNTRWTFPDGNSASSDAVVANAFTNKSDFAFDITLSGEDTPIFTSTIIPVGTQFNKIKLDKPLAAGTYDAICNYHLLDEEGNEKSSLAVTITIIIEK